MRPRFAVSSVDLLSLFIWRKIPLSEIILIAGIEFEVPGTSNDSLNSFAVWIANSHLLGGLDINQIERGLFQRRHLYSYIIHTGSNELFIFVIVMTISNLTDMLSWL